MSPIWIVVTLALIIFVGWVFNSFIRLRVMSESAASDIEVQLKRRTDLIPNLVTVVQSYAKHEKTLLTRITKLRTDILSAKSLSSKLSSNQSLNSDLKSLLAVVEDYPELRASDNFLSLQKDLTETENNIEYSRRFYNGAVRDYNTKIQIFPFNILAGILHFEQKPFFDDETDAI
jgi:LemA protein